MAVACLQRQVPSAATNPADRPLPPCHYDPSTGQYVTPDGQVQTLTNVAAGHAAEVVEGPAPDLTERSVSGQLL